MELKSREEALNYVDTNIRNTWEKWVLDNPTLAGKLGKAKILDESQAFGMKAWQYHIDGLPMSRDGRKRWVLSNGERVDTTLSDDEDTIEKAYSKKQKELKENN
jgi:hypothetical protein